MKFFNSDKSGFLSFVAKRMKALFALLFIIAGVQTLSAALVKGDWDGWQNHDLIPVADNEYYVDIKMTNAATDEFGIDFNVSFYSLSNKTITNWCSIENFYTNNSNCKFTHNAGTYRFRVWDEGNYKTLTITGIIVTIDQPVQNADGSYTITGRFTNANPGQQNIHTYQIVFSEGVGQGVGANEPATVGEDGSFSITKQLVEGQQYTCCARAIDGSIGNHDSEYITFTAEAATPESEPTVTDLYIFGVDNNWSNPYDEWKCTSVSQDGNVYTWDWSSPPKTFNGSTYFKVGAKNADNDGIDDNNNYGPSESDVLLNFDGVQSIIQIVVNSKESKAFYVSEETKISKIVFDKSALTVEFHVSEESVEPSFSANITADASVAEQVSLASTLTETAARTDLATATCVFQYKAADAGDEPYADMSETASVIYSGEGATRTATLSQSMAADSYVFRAVWTYNSTDVANAVTETVTIPSDTPTPTDIDFYVRGEKIGCTPSESGNCWGVASEEFKATSKEGNVYVWDWSSEPKLMVGPFKIADANFSNENNYGLEDKTTIRLTDGKWTGTLQVNIESGDMIIREPGWNVSKITFDYDTKKLLIEAETSSSCQDLPDGFTISARLNQGAGAPFEGNLVASDSNTATGGYFADGFRTVTLTTTQVADTYEWKLVGYAIGGNAQATADLTALATITNGDAQTATALLSLPGDYTFQCTAACTDGTPVNSATVTISTYPEMGFDGPIGTPASVSENGWNHAWAGQSGNGLLVRENGSLKWSLTFVYQGVGSTPNDFVVIQRYKRGCVTAPDGGEQGWAGFTECGVIVPGEPDFWGNKINASIIDLASGLGYASTTEGDNFRANDLADEQGWVAGVTELTLTVTMTDWDSYTVELAKKQEQIYANYSSNNEAMGTVAMKVGDISIAKGADITGYIGEQVTLTAKPAQGYKVASWKINGKVTESDKTTISPMLSGAGLNVVVTFKRDCYAGVAYDLTGGGVICANDGRTELSLNTLNNVKYQLYKNGVPYGTAVEGNGEAAKWTISEEGTYTAKAYDSRFEECEAQAIDMKGSAVVTSVPAPEITVNPGVNVHLTVLQARSFTTEVPVNWSITDVTSDGDYCTGDGYMISSQTDTSLVAKFLCIGKAKITATMKAPNQNCMAEVTVQQNGAETELCAPEPEPEDVQ